MVINTLFTGPRAPQRNERMPAEPGRLARWSTSIKGAEAVVLADQLTSSPPGASLIKVPEVAMNVYFRRWLHIWQHLRDHPEYNFVWCTDGTDVEMLREPWSDMVPGMVYVGSEPKTYADAWARQHHPERIYRRAGCTG